MVINTIILGLIFSLLGYGIFISFKILNFTDLTAEASFTLGAAISVVFCQLHLPFLGLIVGIIGGMLTGLITGVLHTTLHIDKALSGILTLTAFYTINLWVTGLKPNIALTKGTMTLFIRGNNVANLFIALAFVIAIAILMRLFFLTKLGLSIRACGDNENMIPSIGQNSALLKIFGLCLSNGLIALSGALFMQYQRYYDSSFGTGMMVVGVATIILGETLIRFHHNMTIMIIALTIGSILYRFIYLLVLQLDGDPTLMKLISAIFLIACIVISKIRFVRRKKYANT